MKSVLVIVGMVMFVAGLVALYFGITAMAATPCFVDELNCDPNAHNNIMFFPLGLASVILGTAAWTAGATQLSATGSSRHPLAFIGFFGIFGMTFLGVGLVMFIADQQPTTDHITNVLTILGIVFGLVGIISIGVEVASRFASAADARILATGIRGRATVTGVRDSNVTVNNNPMITLDLRVEIPGQPVFTQTVRQVISRLEVGSYRPGMVLAVAADPAKPRDIVIDWDRSPLGDAGADRDPVTGQPTAATAAPAFMSGAPVVSVGGRVPGGDVASILRAAADQVAAGRTVAHPEVASVVGNAGQWSAGASMSPAEVATLLRAVADRVASGGATAAGTGVPGVAAGTTATGATSASGMVAAPGAVGVADATLTSELLAAMLRHASDAAAQAARQAEMSGGSGVPGGGTTSRP